MDSGIIGEVCKSGTSVTTEGVDSSRMGLSLTSMPGEKNCSMIQPILDSKSGMILAILICFEKKISGEPHSNTLLQENSFSLSEMWGPCDSLNLINQYSLYNHSLIDEAISNVRLHDYCIQVFWWLDRLLSEIRMKAQ